MSLNVFISDNQTHSSLFSFTDFLFVIKQELEFQTSPQSTIEDLISINNALDQLEAAQGLVKYAQQYLNLDIKLSWYEKVQRWTGSNKLFLCSLLSCHWNAFSIETYFSLFIAALEKYEELQKQNPNDLEIMIGRMRCMQFLSDWDGVARVAEQVEKILLFVRCEKSSKCSLFFPSV
jgi:FKBP12-rapamycin complex-associated protein